MYHSDGERNWFQDNISYRSTKGQGLDQFCFIDIEEIFVFMNYVV